MVSMESGTVVQSTSDQTGEDMDSMSVTKKLEEELLKRDALIEVCYFKCYCLENTFVPRICTPQPPLILCLFFICFMSYVRTKSFLLL